MREEYQGLQENKGLKGHRDPKVQRDQMVRLVPWDLQERKVRLDHLALLATLGDQEIRVIREHRAGMGHQEVRERGVRMGCRGSVARLDPGDSGAE